MPTLRPIGPHRTGTGRIKVPSHIVGCVLISADGTNLATIELRDLNASGRIGFHIETTTALAAVAPFQMGNDDVWFSISGTGALAQFYEWID